MMPVVYPTDGTPAVGPRGWPVLYDAEANTWVYPDTGDDIMSVPHRPCPVCQQEATPEGFDPCLGELPGVTSACCGHGHPEASYIVFSNGFRVEHFAIDKSCAPRNLDKQGDGAHTG